MLLALKTRSSFTPIKTPPPSPPRPSSAAPDFFRTPDRVYDTAFPRERSRSDAHNFAPIAASTSSSSLPVSPPVLDLFAEIMVSKSQEREDTFSACSGASSTDDSELDDCPSPRRPLTVPKALLDDSLCPEIMNGGERLLIEDTLPHSTQGTLSVGVVVEEYVDLEVIQWMQPLRKAPTGNIWKQAQHKLKSMQAPPAHLREYFAQMKSLLLSQGASSGMGSAVAGGVTTRVCCIERGLEEGLGLHVYGSPDYAGVIITKVDRVGACQYALPEPPRRGDVVVGINGTMVLGKGLGFVLAELSQAEHLQKVVLNLASPDGDDHDNYEDDEVDDLAPPF